MKVLHIFNELQPSGGEVMIEIASKLFQENNINIDILSTGENVGIFGENFIKRGYGVYHIPFKNFWRFISPFFLYKLYKFIKINSYDIVHIHTERGRLSYAIVAYLANVKGIVTTVHHIFPPNNSFFSFIPVYAKIFRRWFMKKILKVVIISNSNSGLMNEKKYYKSDNILIPNWFDDNKYKPENSNDIRSKYREKLNIKKDDIVFVSLGGNWEYKNYHLILDAMSKINDNNIVYLQIGPDPTNSLLKQKEKLELKDNVKLLGIVDDVLPYLYASDVYIMPSSIEGFGVAAVEAMGTGLPAILSNRPALHDFKLDSNEIMFIEPNVDEIVKAMLFFKNLNKQDLQKKGKIISKTIIAKYGMNNGVKKIINLYKELSENNK